MRLRKAIVRSKLTIKVSLNKFKSIAVHVTVLPISFLALYTLIITVANDVPNYTHIWEISQEWSFIEIYNQRRIEFGSLFILWNLAQYFSATLMIFFTGALALLAKYYLFTKYINQLVIAYFLYVVTFVHILDANQIRAALASCFLMYAILAPPKSKYSYLKLAALGVLFHYSAVIILSLYFVRLKFLLVVLIIIASLSFDYIVVSYEILSFAKIWLSGGDGFVSFVNSFWIMQIFIAILSVANWRYLSDGQQRGALLNIMGIVVYISFYASPIIAHRVRELSQLGILAILFLGPPRLTYVTFGSSLCFAYIVGYNVLLIASEIL